MITEAAAQRVKALIDDAVAKGAKLRSGGNQEGVFIDPTILDGVTPSMRLYRDECFGPVAAVIRVSGVDEAVSVANDCEYGLAAAVFGRDVTRALTVAQRIESGICHINGPTIQDEPQMPFGGVKSSGYGRFGGRAGIEAFTELRWITIQSGRPTYPI
jgi:acyl-CoA reductase-like NAD-dependent aldehyde dehydrogenase